MRSKTLSNSPLNKSTSVVSEYDPKQLCAIPRQQTWGKYDYEQAPYFGIDIWNAYEISWLNLQGLPQVAVGEFRIPLASANIIESKSVPWFSFISYWRLGMHDIRSSSYWGCLIATLYF